MADIIGVRFKPGGKLYYFAPNDEYLLQGSMVIVETARGIECGEVVMERRSIPDEQLNHELKKVIRVATPADVKRAEDNRRRESEAYDICVAKIAAHKLEMSLVGVEYAFDGSKILFNFTSESRVDFRELVKDLAGVFKTRIELRQIGVRDEAKLLGGLGICGRPFCCASFMGDFAPVSIRMAKEQGLSLNPVKISGTCGRLMCCLKYEEDAYRDLLKRTPRVGKLVKTPDGNGVVVEVNLIAGTLKVRVGDDAGVAPKTYTRQQVRRINKGQPDEDDFIEEEELEEVLEEPEMKEILEDDPIVSEIMEKRQNNKRRPRPKGSPQGGQRRQPQSQPKPKQGEQKADSPAEPQQKQNQPRQNQQKQNPPKQGAPRPNQPKQNPPKQGEPRQNPPKQGEPRQNPPKQGEPRQNPPKQNPPIQGEQKQGEPNQNGAAKPAGQSNRRRHSNRRGKGGGGPKPEAPKPES